MLHRIGSYSTGMTKYLREVCLFDDLSLELKVSLPREVVCHERSVVTQQVFIAFFSLLLQRTFAFYVYAFISMVSTRNLL